ncbi:hypothetical protein V7S43_009008 [Phytophthora oleae]|uniref:Uncharacterized protein n=1 Tax=Phytophthora oleae TaxID=2107226 RepID=A0ABD3FHH5_9STRA
MEVQSLFPINVRAREHVEIKACLLAHTHRLDVDELHRIRGNNQLALNRFKMQRIISRGGAFSTDGSAHEEAKRKTTFLLRHFFALQDTSSPQDQLLCDVVDDWAVGDHATSDEISRLWKGINEHIERSYLLRRKLVANSDPDEISVTIAMDCLKKLPEQLPEYRRVLDVIVAVIESGLYVNVSSGASVPSLQDPSRDDEEFLHERKLLYFKAFRALQTIADTTPRSSTCRGSIKYPWQDKNSDIPFRQRIEDFFNQLENEDDKKELLGLLLRGNLATLAASACEEVLKFYLETGYSERAGVFLSLLMQKMNSADTTRLLNEISHSHLEVLQKFALENVDCLVEEAPIASDPATEKKIPALFQRLVDQHPNEFAAILWRSPYLTAHIFQGSENLVARVLEQNVYRISQVLTQRGEVLLPLLSHTFKENTVRSLSSSIVNFILKSKHVDGPGRIPGQPPSRPCRSSNESLFIYRNSREDEAVHPGR